MQLAASSRTVQRGVCTRRSSRSVAVSMPVARCMRSARPSRTPVRTFAQAAGSVVGERTTAKKRTLLQEVQDVLAKGNAGLTKLFNLADESPEQVTTLTPEDTKLCIHYATWAWAAYDVDVNSALDKLNDEASIKEKLIPSSLVILSGSSLLKETSVLLQNVKTDTQALMGLQDDGKGGVELVVAFRGSEQKASDWITDFLIDMDPAEKLVDSLKDPKMQIHAGFTESANDFLTESTTLVYGHRDATDLDRHAFERRANHEELFDKEQAIVDGDKMKTVKTLKELATIMAKKADNKPITKVVVCGHSLGGALATLTSYWCRKVGWPDLPVEYYSYGAPRVANHKFAAEWAETVGGQTNAKAFRVMHRNDMVPAVPRVNLPDLNDPAFDTYIHVSGGVLLVQPGKDPMIGNQGNPKWWPELAVDPVNGFQAQCRRRPHSVNNHSADDHRLYAVDVDTNKDVKKRKPTSEEGYIAALKNTLKNYTGKYEPLSG